MSANSNFLKTTTDLIETSLEIKSFIHQQIIDFQPFITPETLILVIARDPEIKEGDDEMVSDKSYKHRIAIVLKEDESSIEAEAFNDDIYEAIKAAKEELVSRLVEIQSELETSQDRLAAIHQAGSSNQVH
ncbi:MAG: hypothetical protein A2622_03825 [Bdellovibrionales bacterium RIFCSPHIGHO2_01_FULL_40_29]|nr:MAG: hypothetical protein A2622_03825 [Bdellovibrionales bacterium RIFCSPHIGHO2_01_FULL_40_29]OFZ35354.1 MAG: hypothetical protein A3D17_08205 [Bdellovibrionales bacterium RIFCSPHIGHO2_02_FULL_40_15]